MKELLKNRLTYWTGETWIARQERINGKIIGDRQVYYKLAKYEDIGSVEEFKELSEREKPKTTEKKDYKYKAVDTETNEIYYYNASTCLQQMAHKNI